MVLGKSSQSLISHRVRQINSDMGAWNKNNYLSFFKPNSSLNFHIYLFVEPWLEYQQSDFQFDKTQV